MTTRTLADACTAARETIVIYHHEATERYPESGWYFVHAEKHRGPFESQRAAKNAVAETFLMFEYSARCFDLFLYIGYNI